MASRELKVNIVGDSRSLERALRNSGNAAEGFGSKMSKMSRVVGLAALGAGAAITAGFVYTLKRGFDELAESQKVMAQTEAVLKSTGGVAKVTAKQVEELASSLSVMSGTDDEAIQASENLLLTFKNVRNEVGKGNDAFNRATLAALNLSQAGFGSLESASKMMGKALNDPIKGMTALGRAGVTFSEDQKAAIAALVETGDLLGAQKLILKEVESQVGGSAKAYGETLPGQLAKARNAFDEIAGKVALKFLPALTDALDWVNANWSTIEKVMNAVATAVIVGFEAIGTAITFLRGQWEIHRATVIATWTAVQNAVKATIDWFKANVVPAIQTIVTVVTALWERFGADFTRITQTTFGVVITLLKTYILNFLAPFRIFLDVLRGDWGAAWDEIKATFSRTIGAIITLLKGYVANFLTVARALGGAIVDGVVAGLSKLVGSVRDGFQALWGWIEGAGGTAKAYAFKIGAGIVSGIANGLGGIKDAIYSIVRNAISSAFSALLGWLGIGSPSRLTAELFGEPMAAGIIKGFTDGISRLPDVMTAGIAAATSAVGDTAFAGAGGAYSAGDGVALAGGGQFRTGAGSGGGDLHIHVGTVIGTSLDAAAQEINNALMRHVRRGGQVAS